MKSLVKEPLVHFVLAALLIFGGHNWWTSFAERRAQTIYVTEADLERMAALYAAETGQLPPPHDMQAMLADHVRQRVLVREAKRLGLDSDDTVVDRRLAQKMEFMIADLSESIEPSETELKDWHAAHEDRFRKPATISFRHVFLSESSASSANALLEQLNSDPGFVWQKAGDPFMLQRQYGALPKREIARLFGPRFSDELFNTEHNERWHGPVPSPFGSHIVQIIGKTPADLPDLSDIRSAVEKDWQDHNRREANAAAISDLIKKYDIVVEGIEN